MAPGPDPHDTPEQIVRARPRPTCQILEAGVKCGKIATACLIELPNLPADVVEPFLCAEHVHFLHNSDIAPDQIAVTADGVRW